MALNNLAKSLKFMFLNKLSRFFILRAQLPEMVVSINSLTNKNLDSKAFNLPHTKALMRSASVYESLINQNVSQTKFCTKSEKECECEKSDCADKTPSGRHQFHKETEEIINKQIESELTSAFSYLSMACYFGRTEVALPGCQGFFMNMYEEELGHALVFINYLLLRGAYVDLPCIHMPECQDWESIEKAFFTALEMEKDIKEKLVCVFDIAEKHKDLEVMDMVSTQFMEEQNRSICEMARLLRKAKMTDDPLGEYLFDKLVYNSFVKKSKDNLMYKKKIDGNPVDEVYK